MHLQQGYIHTRRGTEGDALILVCVCVATIAVIHTHLTCVGLTSYSPKSSGCWSPDSQSVPSTRASGSWSGGQVRSLLCIGVGECSPSDSNRIQDSNTIMAEDIHIVCLLLHLIHFVLCLRQGHLFYHAAWHPWSLYVGVCYALHIVQLHELH
jgi:hypothetical protein